MLVQRQAGDGGVLLRLLNLLLGPLHRNSPDLLDTVAECGDLSRLQGVRSSRKLGLHQRDGDKPYLLVI